MSCEKTSPYIDCSNINCLHGSLRSSQQAWEGDGRSIRVWMLMYVVRTPAVPYWDPAGKIYLPTYLRTCQNGPGYCIRGPPLLAW